MYRQRQALLALVLLVGSLTMACASTLPPVANPAEDFSNWSDICVESVEPIAVGNTKPFSPWSPDGEWIAYSNVLPDEWNTKVTEPPGIYVIKYDGTGKRLVAPDGVRPSFGRYQWQIVYGKPGTSGKPGYKGSPEEDIWIVDFDGTENRPIAADEEDNRMKVYGGSSLTYDGKHVIYMIMDVGIGTVDIDGSNKRTLVRSGVWGYSKDGGKVFVESVDKVKKGYVVGGWMDIETGDIETGDVEWITAIKHPEKHYGHPHVNFDGTMIAYDNPKWENRNIWVGMLDGSNKHYQLTDYVANFGEGTFANHPRWSPDGKWIVYDEQTFVENGVKDKVMIINLETREKKEIWGGIVPRHSGWTEPGWSPDGGKLFFFAPDPDNDDKQSIWIAGLRECDE